MSDRPLTQQRLAAELASLVEENGKEVVVPFLSAFWKTMAREWRGIDVLRYEYYYRHTLCGGYTPLSNF